MRSIWRTLDRDLLRAVALICLSVGIVGVSYGAVAAGSGLPRWLPMMTAPLVLAASSEFLFIGIIAGGGNPFAAALAGLVVNARHLAYGLAVPDVIQRGLRRLPATHLMNDETVVLALAQPDLARKRAAYWAAGAGILLCWPAGTLAGVVIGSTLHDPAALGLGAVFPASILALVLPALRERGIRRAALTGAAIALAGTAFLPAGVPEILSVAGVAASLTRPKAPDAR